MPDLVFSFSVTLSDELLLGFKVTGYLKSKISQMVREFSIVQSTVVEGLDRNRTKKTLGSSLNFFLLKALGVLHQ